MIKNRTRVRFIWDHSFGRQAKGENVGLFSSKPDPMRARSYPLKQGTQIPMVDVSDEWVAWARAEKPRQPKIGHVVGVALWVSGQDILVLAGTGGTAGRMTPRLADLYIPELLRLQKRGCIGTTDAFVKWEGSKSPHAISLNYSENAAAFGGIL